MLQEIIVYLILIFTALHILYKSIEFFKPTTNNKSCSSGCISGSCSGCSLKFDMDTIQYDPNNHESKKNN
jgi:hypothetical protein